MKRESEYHKAYYGERKGHKKFFIFLIIVAFLGLAFAGFYFGVFEITGNVVNQIDLNKSLSVKTSLNVPELSMKGDYKEVLLVLERGSSLYAGDKKISLENSENSILFKDFSGTLNFNGDRDLSFEGKTSELKVNSVPITLKENGKIEVSLNEGTYKSIEIKEGSYINYLNYVASGEIYVEEDLLRLKSENFILNNYLGSLKVSLGKFILDGDAELLKIEGDLRRISFQK